MRTTQRKTMFGAASLLAVLGAVAPASGDELAELRQQLKESQQQIEALAERIESASNQPAAADEETAERIDLLEELVFDLDERVGGDRAIARAFDALNLDIGGFLTQQYSVLVGESGTEDSFNATQFELLVKADVTENISLFTTLGFLQEADINVSDPEDPTFDSFAFRNPLIISWANFRHSEALEFQAGRFITPHGIINIEHFSPVLLEVNQPQFLRPFSGNTLFPNFVDGAQLHGKFFVGDQGKDVFSYNIYGGAFVGGDPDNTSVGARAQYEFGDSGFTAGLNYSFGRRTGEAQPAPGSEAFGNLSSTTSAGFTTNDYNLVGADLLYDKGKILWKNEFFYSDERGEEDRLAFYTQPAYRFTDQWIGFYRFDYLDPGQDLDESIEHVVGLNYLPVPTVRFRGSYIFRDFNDDANSEANIFQLSVTVSF